MDFSDGFLEMLEDGRLRDLREREGETEQVAKGGRRGRKAGL